MKNNYLIPANSKKSQLILGLFNPTDLWILIPTGVIVNRLLDRKGELTYIDKLTSFFGKDEDFLRKYFYTIRQENTLHTNKTIWQ